jgi:MFS family permease
MWAATFGLLVHTLSGLDSPSVLLGLVAVQSAAFAISSPTRSAIVPRLVPEDMVAAANTLGFTVSNVGQVLGPLGAGLVLARGDIAVAYGIDAALFTVAMWAALRLPPMAPAARAAGAPNSRLGDLVESLRFLRQQPVLLLTFAIDIAAMVLAMPRAVFPEVAAERFGGDKAVGWLYSAIAIGAVVAGLGSGWVTRVRRQGLVIVAAVVGWGLAVALAGLAPVLWLVVVGLAVAGAADLVSAAFRQTILLTHAPDEMRGRMQGAFIAVVAGGPRLGDLRIGAMAAATGATVAWVSGGVAAAVVAVLLAVAYPALLRYTSHTSRDAER